MSGSTEPLALVPAEPSDLGDIAALANLAYRGSSGWNSETGLMEGERATIGHLLAENLAQPDSQLLVHRQAGDLFACVRVEPKGDGLWHLGLLAVRPELQARQLGRRILESAEAYARERGGTLVRIGVINLRDTLIAWYERRGYRRTGQSEPFPYGDESFGRPLRPGMAFVVLDKAL